MLQRQPQRPRPRPREITIPEEATRHPQQIQPQARPQQCLQLRVHLQHLLHHHQLLRQLQVIIQFGRENSNYIFGAKIQIFFIYFSGVSSSSSTSSSSVRNVTNLANLPPSERPKAKPSRKIVNNQQNNNAGGNSNNVVTDKSKKCQLQAALQQHSQQLAQLQQVRNLRQFLDFQNS